MIALKDKVILAVDDEPDVLESIKELLDICLLHTAGDYETALEYIITYNYDVVILDVMGVNGFELLKKSVSRGFPTVMLTAHALSQDSLKKSIKLGAVSFLPKEKMSELDSFITDVVLGQGKPVWQKHFEKLGGFFNERFSPDWREKDRFFKDFVEQLKKERSLDVGHIKPNSKGEKNVYENL